jgi:microcompartment protein CcmK/EutM
MRMGIVRGTVVLSVSDPSLLGTRFLVVEIVTAEALRGEHGPGSTLIVADHLSPAVGQVIAFVEGREAANPYWPRQAPVDAYCSLIVDQTDYQPPPQSDVVTRYVA